MVLKRLSIIILLSLLVLPISAQALIVKEECLNSTHIEESYNFTLTENGASTDYVFYQLLECTNGCSNNKCNTTESSVDMNSVWLVFAIGISLLVMGTLLGMPFGKLSGKEVVGKWFDTQMAVRYLFFFVGIFFLYLSLTMARRIGADYGGIGDVTSATDTATMVTLITIVLFLFLFIVETLFYIVKRIGDANLKKKYGEREFGEQ